MAWFGHAVLQKVALILTQGRRLFAMSIFDARTQRRVATKRQFFPCFRRISAVAVLTVMASVAHAEMPGFKSERVDVNQWQVRYMGAGFSTTLKTEHKLRCKTAQLGIKSGYAYMHFVDFSSVVVDQGTVVIAQPGSTYGIVAPARNPVAQGLVEFYKEARSDDDMSMKEWMKIWDC